MMSRASQTMRIDISPDLKEELRHYDKKRGRLPLIEPPPQLPEPSASPSTLGGTDFQELLQSVYDGAIIADMGGQIVDANTRVMNFLQYPREKLLSFNLTQVISGATKETLDLVKAGIEKDRFILIQAYCSRQDKTLFPAEIAVNRLNVRGSEYLCCFIRDITWRQQAEEMLRTIHTAIQNAATGIAISDLNGQIDYLNQAGARLWGMNPKQGLVGLTLKDLIPDRGIITAIIDAVKKGEHWDGKIALSAENGPTTHIQMSVAPNRDADEQLIGMVMSFLDISDRIRATEAEQQADRQRVMVESLGAACHHLGQPATVLLASLELLSRVKQTDTNMAAELLSSSIDAAESLRKMLHNLNDITEYKTTPYIENRNGDSMPESRILDVNTVRE